MGIFSFGKWSIGLANSKCLHYVLDVSEADEEASMSSNVDSMNVRRNIGSQMGDHLSSVVGEHVEVLFAGDDFTVTCATEKARSTVVSLMAAAGRTLLTSGEMDGEFVAWFAA